jgi:hypothetical protein
MRRPSAITFVALLVGACADPGAPTAPEASTPAFAATGSPATHEVTRSYNEATFTLAGGVVGCVGEPVIFTWRQETRLQSTSDGAGGLHLLFVAVDKGSSGIGANSGTEYRVRESATEQYHVRGTGYPATFTAVFTRHFISPGSAPNFRVHNVNHFHLDADGELTVDFGHSVRTCT